MRSLMLIIIGCCLIPLADRLNTKATIQTDEALDAPRTIHNPLPDDKVGDFFGQDPREAAKTPEGQAGLSQARKTDRKAALVFLIGIACFALVVLRQFRRSSSQTEKEPPCGTAGSS